MDLGLGRISRCAFPSACPRSLAAIRASARPSVSYLRGRIAYLVAGAAALASLTLLLPLADTLERSAVAWITAYALVLACVTLLLHGLSLLARGRETPRLLALCAATAAAGAAFSLLSRPETLDSSPGLLALLSLISANLLRIAAAVFLGISLARQVSSIGVVLLVVGVAGAADLWSVFAGPTKTLVAQDSPVLDVLLLPFPTFGSVLGFGLGVSDFVFLALFAGVSRTLGLRYTATLIGLCAAAFLALSAGLLLGRPLPALPFIAGAFLLLNADLILGSLVHKR